MTAKGWVTGCMSETSTTSPFFLNMSLGHEQVISDLKQAAINNTENAGQAKRWLDDQIDLVPTGRNIRKDDCETFYGLVRRAKILIQQEQDKIKLDGQEVQNDGRKEKE